MIRITLLNRHSVLVSLFLLLLLVSPGLLAQTVWVDDRLVAPLRTGQGTEYRILDAGLVSGTPLEVLERNEETGYTRVRTPKNMEGWILTRYLSNEPIAQDLLERARRDLEKAQAAMQQAQQTATGLQTERDQLQEEGSALREEVRRLSNELNELKAISSNALSLDQRNKELQETTQALRDEVELLTTDNQRLRDKSESNFMLLGAGLVGLGVLIAVILPMLRPTRKSDTWA